MAKILVLGSNAFSAASFIDYCLDQGDTVIGVSRSSEIAEVFLPYKTNQNYKNFSFYQYDLNHHNEALINLIKQKQPNFMVNFIALGMVSPSFDYPLHYYHSNFVAHVVLLDTLRKLDFLQKYLHISTPEVYGHTEGLVQENFNYNPSTPYAVSKASIDMHLKVLQNTYKFPVVWTRAANVYGASQQLYRIIPRTILYFLTNKSLHLHGGGVSIRSFIHIKDVAKASYKILKQGIIGNVYHLSTKEQISIRDLVFKIAKILQVDFQQLVKIEAERLGKDKAYLLDSSKFHKAFHMDFDISLEEGLTECINWVKTNLNTLLKQNLDYIHKA